MADIKDPENTIIIELKDGNVVIELLPDVAPKHVERMKTLARAGAYDNVAFHRVIEGFMAQTGDVQFGDMENGFEPGRAGTGGSSLPDIEAEFSSVPFERGTVGMARSQDPNSANSQFFVCFTDAPWLNKQYSVWGQVIEGMDIIDLIKNETISGKIAKDLFEILWTEGGDPAEQAAKHGMKAVTDTGAIEKALDDLIAANPEQVEKAKVNAKLAGWFTGQVLKATGGKANPAVVNAMVAQKLGL